MEPIILPRVSDKRPLVSVISITYNHEPYIRDCLEGFAMQKTTFPIEVIIHDDASTDHTADIIREYYEKRPDLFHVIIERENCYSRHKPIMSPLYAIAQGKYIALCEGDDYWTDPNKLQKQFDFMESHHNFSLCFHNSIRKNAINNKETIQYPKKIKSVISLKEVILGGGGLMATASLFFRKDKIDDFFKFKNGCPVGDYPLAIFLATKGNVKYFHELMSVYRTSVPGSWSNRISFNDFRKKTAQTMILWLDQIANMVHSQDEIDSIKGCYFLTILEIENKYSQIPKNYYAMKYIKMQSLTTRFKYFIKYTFPIAPRIKKFICYRQW